MYVCMCAYVRVYLLACTAAVLFCLLFQHNDKARAGWNLAECCDDVGLVSCCGVVFPRLNMYASLLECYQLGLERLIGMPD